MCSEGKPMIGPVIIEKAESFYDEMKVSDKCTFCEVSNEKFPLRTLGSVHAV
jgi:hypothetical protein